MTYARLGMVKLAVLGMAASYASAAAFASQAPLPRPPVSQTSDEELTHIVRSQHKRLVFPQPIQRIAVADTEILTAELITNREVLVLGRETGRTTVIVWFTNGLSREYVLSV